MIESSRGHESNSTSRDLMARFDMAHDRADRLPEVRAYLENLRPRILKLQAELRLQTQEDIDGLVSRTDIDMGEVERLTSLIQAFSKAWRENALSPSETEKYSRERLVRDAVPAWKTILETVDRIDTAAPLQEKQSAIMAIARAGEPELAWELYSKISTGPVADEHRTESDLLARLAIWEAYSVAKRTPPFSLLGLTDGPIVLRKLSDHVIEAIVNAMASGGMFEARSWVMHLSSRRNELKVFSQIRARMPDQEAIGHLMKFVEGPMTSEQVTRLFLTGETDAAIGLACKDGKNVSDPDVAESLAEGYAMAGEPEKALGALDDAKLNDVRRMRALGRVSNALLENGHVASAREVIETCEPELMRVYELARVIIGFAESGESELAVRLAHVIADHDRRIRSRWHYDYYAQHIWGLALAIASVARTFADRGLPTAELVQTLEQFTMDFKEESDMRYRHVLVETRTDIAFRTFKRAAKQFMSTSDRAAWDEALAEIADDRTEISDKLTYGPTLP